MSVTGGPTWTMETPDDTGLTGWGWLQVDLSALGGPTKSYIPLWEDLP
jgi:hypothetical protein